MNQKIQNIYKKVSHGETICLADCSLTGAHRPCSRLANASQAALAMATLPFTVSVLEIACTVVDLGDGKASRQADGSQRRSLNAPYRRRWRSKAIVCSNFSSGAVHARQPQNRKYVT